MDSVPLLVFPWHPLLQDSHTSLTWNLLWRDFFTVIQFHDIQYQILKLVNKISEGFKVPLIYLNFMDEVLWNQINFTFCHRNIFNSVSYLNVLLPTKTMTTCMFSWILFMLSYTKQQLFPLNFFFFFFNHSLWHLWMSKCGQVHCLYYMVSYENGLNVLLKTALSHFHGPVNCFSVIVTMLGLTLNFCIHIPAGSRRTNWSWTQGFSSAAAPLAFSPFSQFLPIQTSSSLHAPGWLPVDSPSSH